MPSGGFLVKFDGKETERCYAVAFDYVVLAGMTGGWIPAFAGMTHRKGLLRRLAMAGRRVALTGVLVAFTITLIFGYAYGDVLFGEEYYETLRKYIAKAEESIVVAMYFIIMEDESPVSVLIDDLIAAKKRGVEVEVVIEDTKLGESLRAYNKLKENGVNVRTDLPGKLLHIKGVVIDGRYVFLGSANWTRAAIEDNYEGTSFEDSKLDAQDLMRFIENAKVEDEVRVEYEGVTLPVDFLLSPTEGRVFLKKKAGKQLDLYLLLLRHYAKTGNSTFEVNEKALAEEMGYTVPEDLGAYKTEEGFYHDTIRNILARLKKRGFLECEKRRVTLKIEPTGGTPGNESIVIPYEYWEYGYAKALSTLARYMYLICLYEAPRSMQYPYWFHSQKDMAKIYGMSRPTLTRGLRELEKIGILEVTRSKPRPPDFSARKANVYKLLPLKPLGN